MAIALTLTQTLGEGVLTALDLKIFQYAKILDMATGVIRVVRGEDMVFLGATEKFLGEGKVDAIEIDTETAVQVRSKRTGELSLISSLPGAGTATAAQGLFIPKPEEEITQRPTRLPS